MSQLPDEDRIRIHQALVEAEGDRKKAGLVLGMTIDEVNRKIQNCKYLKLCWAKNGKMKTPTPPGEIDMLTGNDDLSELVAKQLDGPSTDEQFSTDLAKAMQKEDKRFNVPSFAGLGLSTEEQELAEELLKFADQGISTGIQLTSASISRTTIKMNMEMDRILSRLVYVRERIAAIREYAPVIMEIHGQSALFDPRAKWVEEERMLMNAYATLIDRLRQIGEMQWTAAKTIAVIKFRAKGGNTERKIKPAFGEITSQTDVQLEEDQ